MSNVETSPSEVTCVASPGGVAVLEPREVPLGGPRAMTVRRTLPQRARSLIGAWCFADHYGPDDVSVTGRRMEVAGHPHTGLQTVSWLFSGEVEHRDTTGTHAYIRPGELNLMTAGAGIAHSEYSTPGTTLLHGVQLWVALPESHRFVRPAFEHYTPPEFNHDGAHVRVFIGSLLGRSSPVRTFTPLLGAELTLPAGGAVTFDVDAGFEHGVLVDTGRVSAAEVVADSGRLIYLPAGSDRLTLRATGDRPARLVLLGGPPLGERIVMWWNFVGRSHDEIVGFRQQWQDERATSAVEPGPGGRRFGAFPTQWRVTLPAPELPNARLRPRG